VNPSAAVHVEVEDLAAAQRRPLLIGYTSETILWLTVGPARLGAVAEALATHQEIAYAAATTGPSNVVAFVVCRDHADLYDYLATRLGTTPGVQHVETAPVIRRVKRTSAAPS
jgi:DNA-binding Lrp family transcriptional regulator